MKPTKTILFGCQLLLAALFTGNGLSGQSAVPVTNPTFADDDHDGLPDGWSAYPAYDGLGVDPAGGVRLNDQSDSRGLGVKQWVSVAPNTRYRATVETRGTGGLFVYMIFTDRIPAKDGDVGKIKLLEKREWASAAKSPTSVVAVAPASAQHMQLWIYSPNGNKADVTISSISLENLGVVKPASIAAAPAAAPRPAASGGPAVPVAGNLLQNPTFADNDGDRTPDAWEPFPAPKGDLQALSTVSGGGLLFKDSDKNNGLGLEQWVQVQPGLRYEAAVPAVASGGVRLSLTFVSEKPVKAGDIGKVQLAEKSAYLSSSKPTSVAATAPAGAAWVKVWLYCPKVGLADVVIPQITLTAAADTTSKPAGVEHVIDFETGDFSQAHSTEGAEVKVITAAEGPVREGKYAFKAALRKDKHRAEVVGHRSPPYGIARYGWSLYVPREFDAHTHFSIITQWHDWGTGRESPPDGGPPTSVSVGKGKVSLKINYQGDDGWTTKGQYLPVCDIEELRGQWSDWVLEANWQPPGKGGWLKLYLNGKVVVDYTGTTFYEDKDKGRYFKFGNYKGGGTWKGEEAGAVLYFDSHRMAVGENSTFQMVDPATYSPRPAK